MSSDQEIKKLEQDALFTRFVELFREFFHRSPVTLQCLDLDLPELHQLFHYSWDKKVLPSKQVLMKAVHIRPSPMSFAGKSEDNVAEDFAAALEALEIEEHNEEASLPQHPQQKSKPGRKANPEVALRREIVRKHIKGTHDFDDESKLKLLLQELDEKKIPPPEDIDKLSSFTCSWKELLKKPGKLVRVVKVLNRDRWPKKKAT